MTVSSHAVGNTYIYRICVDLRMTSDANDMQLAVCSLTPMIAYGNYPSQLPMRQSQCGAQLMSWTFTCRSVCNINKAVRSVDVHKCVTLCLNSK